jgi:hypothetical protein
LEKLEQYLEYDIEPPANLAKMHARWTVLMQEKRKENEALKSEKINEVWMYFALQWRRLTVR